MNASPILDLILAGTRADFAATARSYLDRPKELEALTPSLLRETSLRHYRTRYPKHCPHAVFALLGGMEARDLLTGPERAWPVLKALDYVSREKHYEPFPVDDIPARGGVAELEAALVAADFLGAYGAVRSICALGRAGDLIDPLLRTGSLDRFNLSHKFIYPVKILERLVAGDVPTDPAFLFPAIHYHCLTPEDHSREALLPSAEQTGEAALSVFVKAVRRMTVTRKFAWVPFAHVAAYAEGARFWLDRGAAAGRFHSPARAAAFLSECSTEPPPERVSVPTVRAADPVDLERAIAARDPLLARSLALALLDSRSDRHVLGRSLLLACSRIDAGFGFSHDVKVTATAVRLSRERPEVAAVLPDVAGFLAGLPPERATMGLTLPAPK